MSSCHEAAVVTLRKLIEQGRIDLTDGDFAIFEKRPDVAQEHNERLAQLYEAVLRGFFACASEGVALYPEHKVAERFGNTIEQNYPKASDAFLRFGRTYWTLRVLVYDLMEDDMDWVGAHLLGKLEQEIGPVFFPFPGPHKIAPAKREKFQRELLSEFAKDIDVEEFMQGNPILIRDKQACSWERLKRFVRMFKAFFGGLLLKLFPSMGPRGVIDTQITVYKRLKKKFPAANENDILNSLIMSRIKAPLSPTSRSEEYVHYEALLHSPNKTIEDVIWAIVEYEYILSREHDLHRELGEIGAEPAEVVGEFEAWQSYIKERVRRMKTTI